MTDNSTGQTPPEFEKITPTKIEIVPQYEAPSAGSARLAAPPQSGSKKIGLGLVLLGIIAILVFFLLPRVVVSPQVAPDQETAAIGTMRSKQIDQATAQPWQEAQLAKDRKQAQDILAQLLDKQTALEERHVELWGGEQFAAAKALALKGDELYRQRDFAAAAASYQEGLDDLTLLLESVEQVLAQRISSGWDALAQDNAQRAAQEFAIALEIDPNHGEASRGAARAATFDQVWSLYKRGQQQARNNQLDEARRLLREALALDAQMTQVTEALRDLDGRIAQRDFTRAMSVGLKALAEGDFVAAREQFNLALRIRPGSTEASDGLAQVSHQLAQNKIAQHRVAAEQQVVGEQWTQARQSYQEILRIDESLIFAQQGLKMADDRIHLDALLEGQLQSPQRLSTPAVYQEAQALLTIARKVERPGPRLTGQVTRLQVLLRDALEPVVVEIRSDNQTDVTLYKVEHMGSFTSRKLSLKPGTYVLVGKRKGYRDVRRELTIIANQPVAPLVIECVEII